jgi:Ubiquitin family
VLAPDGTNHMVGVAPSDDLPAIKSKIESATNVVARRQLVKFNEAALPADGKTVKDVGIKEGSELVVEIHKVPIKVMKTLDDKSFTVLVDPTETLNHLKSLISPEADIPFDNQILSKEGQLMDDGKKSLEDYGVEKDSVLNLEPKTITVNVVTPDGQTHQLDLASSCTSDDVKKEVEKKTGMEVPRQVLSFDGRYLPSDTSTIKEMGIREGSTLEASVFTIPITVNTWDNKSFEVQIDPTTPLLALKDEVAKKTSIAVNNQVLIHGETQLTENQKTIKDNGVNAKDVVYVEPALLNVNVKTPDGKVHEITIAPVDDCKAIKNRIADATGLAMSRQVLKKDGSYMPTGKPAKEMGVVDGSTLDVEILRFPILVNTPDDQQIKIMVEPCETLSDMKDILESKTGIKPKLQILSKGGKELIGEAKRMIELGLQPGAVVDLKRKDDFIVIVDVKYGTLFGVDRDQALSLGVLTMKGEKGTTDFIEATADTRDKEQMRNSMLEAPKLGVKPRVVVEKIDVEDYDLEEAEAVKSKWGVQLKKTQKNTRGSELLFVDIKHGTFGFLDRKKMEEEIKLVTPVGQGKDATIQEAEKDAQKYDNFVKAIRTIFGIASL